MKKRVIAIILVLVAGTALIWKISSSSTTKRGGPLELAGNVDIREANLGFRVAGKIQSVFVEEGDFVTNSTVLAQLDPEPYKRGVEAAAAQVAAAKARLALLKTGYRIEEIAQARAVARERTVAYENAKRVFERMETLHKATTVSQQVRDDAEAHYRETEARMNSAKEQLALLEAGFRQEEVAGAEAELQRSQAALASAQLQLDDTILRAPTDGVILTRAQEPGAMVQAGTTILTLSVRDPVWVRAYVHEPDLNRIVPGMKVEVLTDSRLDKPYEGQIGYVSPRAEFTPRNVETKELRTSLVYRFRVTVSNPDDGLRQGMPATVRIPNSATKEASR